MTAASDTMSARLNLSISLMLGRNIRATFKHINARVVRELDSGAVPGVRCPVDRFTRETIEGAQCWRDPRARRHRREAAGTVEMPSERTAS
ncbi:hypothetical protein J2T08_003623 [Neorhizobium galegae]|nr:hypothetical protein [Neorhizobium galegae]